MDVSGAFLYFTSSAFVFIIAELIEWSLLVHDDAGWHYRFKSPDGHRNLRLTISAFKAACIIFAISLIVAPFVLPEIWSMYVVAFVSSTQYWILLFFMSISFSFLWIWHHVVGKAWNDGQKLLVIASVVFLILYIVVNLMPYVSQP